MSGKERGCGTRVQGGIYAEVPLSPFGMPVECFLIEPPKLIDAAALGVAPIGVKLIEKNGVWHVLDWIGEQHYPNVADMVEEVRHMGLSRRLPRTLDFEKLTPDSRIILLHRKADVEDWTEYQNTDDFVCPKVAAGLYPEGQAHPEGMCIATWWHDVTGGEWNETVPAKRTDGDWTAHHEVTRTMPSFAYSGYAKPEEVTPKYRLAAFASFPIAQITVINDHEGKKHEGALDRARQSSLPVVMEEE